MIVALTSEVKAVVREAVESGESASSSEVVREALALLASVLRGSPLPYPPGAGPELAREVLRLSGVHGVQALLHQGLRRQDMAASWPEAVREGFREAARRAAARELLVVREVGDVLARLAEAGVAALLLKGTPLAYGLYPQPYLRSRGDTDLLVPAARRLLADEALRRAGYEAAESAGGSLASYQTSYSKRGRLGEAQVIDLHWRLSNAQAFARAFSFEELDAAAVSVPGLGPAARTPGAVHALLIACMHRTSHLHAPYYAGGAPHQEANRLIWLYDIHLLARGLSHPEWSRFSDLAAEKRLRAVCLHGLTAARDRLGTPLPDEVMKGLTAPGPRAPSANYLLPGRLRLHLSDVRALPGWGQRLRLIGEWLFPPGDYVLRKYGRRSRLLLPWLYLRRAAAGVAARRPWVHRRAQGAAGEAVSGSGAPRRDET